MLLELLLIGALAAPSDVFGAFRSAVPDLPQPTALVWAEDDTLWITTAGDDAVRHVAPDGRSLGRFGGRGTEPARFRHPSALAVAGETVYVADRDNHRIQVFGIDGTFQRVIGTQGIEPGQLFQPHGIAVTEDRIAIADTGNHRVQILDLTGDALLVLGGWGPDAGRMIHPRDVAFAARGRIVVADTSNDRIQVFESDGRLHGEFGGHGFAPGTVSYPTSVFARGNRIWVTDRDNHRIQVFDANGGLHGFWGRHAVRPRQGNGKLHYPDDFALSPDGTQAAVVEGRADRVQLYSPGTVDPPESPAPPSSASAHYGTGGGAGGALLCVLQPETHTVLVHDLRMAETVEITQIGSFGSGFGNLRRPRDVWVDGSERVWVSDSGNRRLCAFELPALRDAADPRAERARPTVRAARFVLSVDFATQPEEALRDLVALPSPGAIVGSTDGRLFVADERNGCVHVVGEDRRIVGRLGSPGSLERPMGLAFDEVAERLYVVEQTQAQVMVFATDEPSAVPVQTFGALGEGSGRLEAPFGIALDANRRLIVCDRGRHSLERFERDGTHVETLGGLGLERGRFFKPTEVMALSDGRLCIVDQGNHRIQFLRPDGAFDEPFGAKLYTKSQRQE